MRIAYLCCRGTISTSESRRVDAFEHDQMLEALEAALDGRAALVEVLWDAEGIDWGSFDGVLIGSAWDYMDRQEEFLARLETIEAAAPLLNPASLVRWNSRKTYLRELERLEVPAIPTLWLELGDDEKARTAFQVLKTDRIVLKQQVGAGAEGQVMLGANEAVPPIDRPMMAQPFLPAIRKEGEYSFVFIDGQFSHALLKTAAEGDYRIQSAYGGTERPVDPAPADLAAAKTVVTLLPEAPLYARIDMVRSTSGQLLLMEAELIEPFLYPLQGSQLGRMLADALLRRINNA